MAIGTMTAITLGLVAGGAAVSAVGQVKAGNAARRLGDFNAQVAELQATDALARGQAEESQFRQSVRGLIGQQRTGFAGQNVDVGSGSAADVQADAAFLGELDALTIRNNAAREAWGYRVDAQNARLGGQMQQSAARWGAAGTILGASGSILMQRYGWRPPNA